MAPFILGCQAAKTAVVIRRKHVLPFYFIGHMHLVNLALGEAEAHFNPDQPENDLQMCQMCKARGTAEAQIGTHKHAGFRIRVSRTVRIQICLIKELS